MSKSKTLYHITIVDNKTKEDLCVINGDPIPAVGDKLTISIVKHFEGISTFSAIVTKREFQFVEAPEYYHNSGRMAVVLFVERIL